MLVTTEVREKLSGRTLDMHISEGSDITRLLLVLKRAFLNEGHLVGNTWLLAFLNEDPHILKGVKEAGSFKGIVEVLPWLAKSLSPSLYFFLLFIHLWERLIA